MKDPVQLFEQSIAPTDSRRRIFLIGAGLGTVGAAAAVIGAAPAAPVGAAADIATSTSEKGYRETEHVRRYYSTTRL